MSGSLLLYHLVLLNVWMGCFADETVDPCQENTFREYEPWRNINSPLVNSENACDRFIEEKWYRFNTGGGDDSLAQEPVPPGYCGVSFPIWAKDPLPTSSAQGIKDLTVCVVDLDSNCSDSWSIKAKNCDGYHVYLLKATEGCDEAYCAGIDSLPDATTTTRTAVPTTTAAEERFIIVRLKSQLGQCYKEKKDAQNGLNMWRIIAAVVSALLLMILSANLALCIRSKQKKNKSINNTTAPLDESYKPEERVEDPYDDPYWADYKAKRSSPPPQYEVLPGAKV